MDKIVSTYTFFMLWDGFDKAFFLFWKQISDLKRRSIARNITVNKTIFPFLGTRIWVPIPLYKYENLSLEKWLDKKVVVNFEIYDIAWTTNNYNTHITQYLKN